LAISQKITIFAPENQSTFVIMETNIKTIEPKQSNDSQIVIYQPDETISLEVKLDQNTVWLTQAQMAELFKTTKQNVSLHINNIFKEGELKPELVVKDSLTTTPHGAIKEKKQHSKVKLYNLDVIISTGYRVKSLRGTHFRQWATGVLKDYLLKGCSVNEQMLAFQRQIDSRFDEQSRKILQIENIQTSQQQQLDFFIRTSTPPAEMVFFNGQFFTARVALESLIKSATKRAIMIDHYVDAKTFDMFDVRQPGVKGIIFTQGVGPGMTRLRDEHNSQPNVQQVEVFKWRVEPHDRFLVIDDHLYHCGHSINATGNKLSAIMLMGTPPDRILAEMMPQK